jgi:hypothetical protein
MDFEQVATDFAKASNGRPLERVSYPISGLRRNLRFPRLEEAYWLWKLVSGRSERSRYHPPRESKLPIRNHNISGKEFGMKREFALVAAGQSASRSHTRGTWQTPRPGGWLVATKADIKRGAKFALPNSSALSVHFGPVEGAPFLRASTCFVMERGFRGLPRTRCPSGPGPSW